MVEFEPSVVNIAQVWSNYNHAVISNPNVTVTINDVEIALFVEDEPYDVITSDPFEPVMAGAANLYTVDFFELANLVWRKAVLWRSICRFMSFLMMTIR